MTYAVPERNLKAAAILKRYAHDLENGITTTQCVTDDMQRVVDLIRVL